MLKWLKKEECSFLFLSRQYVSRGSGVATLPKPSLTFNTYSHALQQKFSKHSVVEALAKSNDSTDYFSAVGVMRTFISLNPTFGLVNDRTDLMHRFLESSFRCGSLDVAWNTLLLFREQGMQMIRPHAYAMLSMIRKSVEKQVELEGRNISIISATYERLRAFIVMSEEDGILMDYMLWTRYVVIMMQVVGLFDRQLVYKEKWQASSIRKRDGMFVDFVLSEGRLSDYDTAVIETYRLLDEIIMKIHRDIPTRPSFAFMHRLAELFFTCDDLLRMHSVLEDMRKIRMFYPDTLTSKLLQLVASFNYKNMSHMFANWRIYHENAALTAFDFFRILAYYCRSGGGLPCPKCGNISNHRDVSLDFLNSKANKVVIQCEYLELALAAKGEYNDILETPQNKDWSAEAFLVMKWAKDSSVSFGNSEWRLFILCCTNSEKWELALSTLCKDFLIEKWDDILMGTVFRMLRFQAPERLTPLCLDIKTKGLFLHTLALNEALMGVFRIESSQLRDTEISKVLDLIRSVGSPPYIYTIRSLTRNLGSRMKANAASEKEISAVSELALWCKRLGSRSKESFWDIVRSSATRSKVYTNAQQ